MSDSNQPGTDDRMDRFARGELTAAQSRELAQASLDSPELFGELTDTALAKASLAAQPLPPEKVVPFPWKKWLVAGVAAAAAAVLVSIYVVKPSSNAPVPKPALAGAAQPGQPILLAGGFQPSAGAPVFRGDDPDSRAPQTAGSVISVDNGIATVNLGSLDGLAKDSVLKIYRDGQPAEPLNLLVTTVFRDRARAQITGGPVHPKDEVRVMPVTHWNALMDQVDALYNRGDADGALKAAQQAADWAATASLPPAQQSTPWNKLAVLQILGGDLTSAESSLNHAGTSPTNSLAYARAMNNLGVLSELRGDQRKAERSYAAAQAAFASVPDSPAQERAAVDSNLVRSRGAR
jgi:hypothetical protein